MHSRYMLFKGQGTPVDEACDMPDVARSVADAQQKARSSLAAQRLSRLQDHNSSSVPNG